MSENYYRVSQHTGEWRHIARGGRKTYFDVEIRREWGPDADGFTSEPERVRVTRIGDTRPLFDGSWWLFHHCVMRGHFNL